MSFENVSGKCRTRINPLARLSHLRDKSIYKSERIAHWDALARNTSWWQGLGGYYRKRLTKVYTNLVVPGQRVLEVGCGRGDLLAALQPSFGIGVDFSCEMLERARRRHPQLHFFLADAEDLALDEKFDVIIFSDLVDDLWDVQTAFEQVKNLCTSRTRLILNFYSKLWEEPLRLAEKLHLARPRLEQNWLTIGDVRDLLYLGGFELIRSWNEIIWPVCTPLIDALANRVLAKLWPLYHLALTHILVARPAARPEAERSPPRVSVVVPARNEAGNIEQIIERVPPMGAGTEVIFVEGHSTDNTYETIEKAIAQNPEKSCKLLRQTGRGKGDAVRLGFAHAGGDVLMILDADLTVAPEDLPRFYKILVSRKAEFVNGARLVYPIQNKAMRFLNLLGNKFFSLAFSWVLDQRIKDTLCGTKVLWKTDYQLIAANRSYFGDFDPFGDFDLLLGAARLNLKLIDLPIRYGARTYGKTNISRFRHGAFLLYMLGFASRRLKFN